MWRFTEKRRERIPAPSSAVAKTPVLKIGRVSFVVPAVIGTAGARASKRFVEFFTATIRNKNTRLAYARACGAFLTWCEDHGIGFDDIESITISAYMEHLLAEEKSGGLGPFQTHG